MNELNINKRLSYAPAKINTKFCGVLGHYTNQMDSLLKREICLLCYDEPKNPAELSELLGMAQVYIEEACQDLRKNRFLRKTDKGFLTLILMIPEYESCLAKTTAKKALFEEGFLDNFLQVMKESEPEIRALNFYGNDLNFGYLFWCLFFLLYTIVDTGFRLTFEKGCALYPQTPELQIHFENGRFYGLGNYRFSEDTRKIPGDEDTDFSNFRDRTHTSFLTYNTAKYGLVEFNNLFDREPFPSSWSENGFDKTKARNRWLDGGTIPFYLDFIYGIKKVEDFTDNEKVIFDTFVKKGIVKKNKDGEYKAQIPVINDEIENQLRNIYMKKLFTIGQKIGQTVGRRIEEILLPFVNKGDRPEFLNEFYSIWISSFLDFVPSLYEYAEKKGVLEIPNDYEKSCAGLYLKLKK